MSGVVPRELQRSYETTSACWMSVSVGLTGVEKPSPLLVPLHAAPDVIIQGGPSPASPPAPWYEDNVFSKVPLEGWYQLG